MNEITKHCVAIAAGRVGTVESCTDWMDARACFGVDPDVFFPEVGQTAQQAKAVCASCPVAAECLAYALATNETYGVWGGLTPRERMRLPRGRKRRPVAACGTLGGYAAHRRRGEDPCQGCRDANTVYQRERWSRSRDGANARRRERRASA